MLKRQNGYSSNGLPYTRVGDGPRTLVLFDGLDFSHRPPTNKEMSMTSGFIKPLTQEYTVYQVRRKPDLPRGYSLADMAADYAVMIKEQFDGPVDIMGLSTGGSIAQHFAVNHPELVRKLVLAASGHCLNPMARQMQIDIANTARTGRWRIAAGLMAFALYKGMTAKLFFLIFWLMGKSFYSPTHDLDGIIEIEAEDRHQFKDRLKEITAPTLVIGGDEDFFYPLAETAAGIPGAELVLYPRTGHTAIMKKDFGVRVLEFLNK